MFKHFYVVYLNYSSILLCYSEILRLTVASKSMHSFLVKIFLFFLFSFYSWTCRVLSSGTRGQIRGPAGAYATATATPDLNLICELHPSSQHNWIFHPLSESRTLHRILNPLSPNGNSKIFLVHHMTKCFC